MNLSPLSMPLEVLTPAWATGANQQQAEIRVSSIRGQLRFWLRMSNPDEGLDDALFGRADNSGARASCVALHIKSWQGLAKVQNLEDYTGRTGDDALHDPEAYFLWPLRPTRESQQKRGVVWAATPTANANFTVEFTWFPPALPQRARLEPALSRAAKAFSLLGTFGTRSTRGYGSIWPAGMNLANAAALSHELDFLPVSVSVRLLPVVASSGRGALAEAAKWFRKLRLGTDRFDETPSVWGRNDHDVALHPTERDELHRPALGLPLAQNYKNGPRLQTKYRWRDPETGREAWNDRYPSPVRFKVVRIGGSYRVVLVLLRSQLLPDGTRLRLEERGHPIGETRLSHELFDFIAEQGETIH